DRTPDAPAHRLARGRRLCPAHRERLPGTREQGTANARQRVHGDKASDEPRTRARLTCVPSLPSTTVSEGRSLMSADQQGPGSDRREFLGRTAATGASVLAGAYALETLVPSF